MNRKALAALTAGMLVFVFNLNFSVYSEAEKSPAPSLNTGLHALGLSFIDGNTYTRFQLQPDIPLGKIGIGLGLVVLYNPLAEAAEPQFLAEDAESWDSPSTWLRLIRYIRYGQPYDAFHFRFGELDYLTIGHGLIMSGYSNHDRRGIRLNFRGSSNKFGVETVLNDFGNPTIFGGRTFIRPFQGPEESNLYTRFELGATYITDIDPILVEIGEEPLIGVGVDAGLPIFETSTFRFDLYDDIAFLNTLANTDEENAATTELAWGNAIGVGFSWTKSLFKLEYRILGNGFYPSVFDYTYEPAKTVDAIPNREHATAVQRRGFFSEFNWNPSPQIHFFGTFEDYTDSEPKLYLGISESELIPHIAFRAYYTKRDIGESGETGFFSDLFDLDEKSAFAVEVRYELLPAIETIITHEYRFRRVTTADGISQFEPIHKTSFMVGSTANF